mmetsp:Transcript_20270/g.60557  ORF Transcript_20270/g.60557 Transcript_20270/m.60557 type:complete len:411 (+) Transcript_20270:74-1306(+)
MAKFPMVTIEKFQGPCGYAKNASPACHQEDLIIDELRKVKEVNPNVSTIFYYNSVLDFPQYQLHARFLENPSLLLRNADGEILNMTGGGHSCDVFDFGKDLARQLFIEECVNATKTGFVDGCFIDRAVDGTPVDSGDDNHWSARGHHLDNATAEAYFNGHIQMLKDLQTAIGDGPVIANHAYGPPHDPLLPGYVNFCMIEGFGANGGSIEQLQMAVSNGRGVQAHGRGTIDDIAAFLIGAGYHSFYGFGGWSDTESPAKHWSPYFDMPLGEPHGPAVQDSNHVWTRKFGTNVTVTFDGRTNTGHVSGWDLPPAPPSPPTPPLPPSPPAAPTAQCPTVLKQVAYREADVGESVGPTWADCCAQCAAKAGCATWTWRPQNAPNYCHLHSDKATRGADPEAICGTIANKTTLA